MRGFDKPVAGNQVDPPADRSFEIEGGTNQMAIVRWTPARELLTMRDQMDRLMDEMMAPTWNRRAAWDGGIVASFPMDVYQSGKEFVVRATLPGVKAEDLDVSVVGETLTIKATLKEDQDVKDEDWLLKESRASAYTRTITLPSEVQADKVDANLENGILVLRIPKAEAVLPKSIKIKTGSK
jgi:HSP20 family protein